MKLGLYGGSFDPVHHGHLILAREACEQLGLDRVIFLPAAQSPHKLHRQPAPGALRLKMLRAAVADEPAFEVDDLELHRPGPSYTVETLEHFRTRFPNAVLHYFIGSDNVAALSTWHRADELHHLARFVVLGRGAGERGDFPVVERRVDISATDLRARVARGASIRYLVPERVREIIVREKLYRGSQL